MTRIARGKIELRRARIDLRDVVFRAAEDLRLMMRDRPVSFRVTTPAEKVWADTDAARITQVVGSLVHNASKFTRGGDSVTVTLEATNGVAEIRVRDTGAGIEPSLLPKIFDAFVQGERTLARTEGGLGLGLALVKGIAELHGGTVQADSAGKGKRATFVVRIPLAPGTEAEDRNRNHHPRRIVGLRPAHPDRRRQRDAAESLAEIVRMLGHTADVAYEGPSASRKARAHPPEVVLCDLGLPGMTGYEVAWALRAAAPSTVRLFALSGYAQPEDVSRAVEAGLDGRVAKPADPATIEQLLRK